MPVGWVAGVTPLSAANLNTMEADLVTHAALTVAGTHGAVSAATASKMVVRDGSARAKFAAPNAAGDVLIKGTRIALTDMAALTTDKYWKGVGGIPTEADVVSIIATGTYSGNGGNDRQITTGFKCTLVILTYAPGTYQWVCHVSDRVWRSKSDGTQGSIFDLTFHATDGFVVDGNFANVNGQTYYYWAISE